MAYNVADQSLREKTLSVEVRRVARMELSHRRLYHRPHEVREGRLWDVISQAPMSTDHAIARFFVPWLCDYQGWALFTDGDVLFRQDVNDLFALADPQYAVMVVKHQQEGLEGFKKDKAIQLPYPRKNWSSVVLWNCGHEAHRHLTLDILNAWPGRDLHAFKWLQDEVIGELPTSWNYLVNAMPCPDVVSLAHFTLGTPNIPGHGQCPFSDEWFATAKRAGYRDARGLTV